MRFDGVLVAAAEVLPAPAGSTAAGASSIEECVFGRILVASRAVSGFLPAALRPAFHILEMSDWLEVIRVHAKEIAAQVVQLEAAGNRADQKLIDGPVGVSGISNVLTLAVALTDL